MKIRNMRIDDYEEVYKIWSNTKGISLRLLDDSKKGTETFLNRNPNTNFICVNDNKIIGAILCGHDGRKGFIYHTVVLKEYRNKGIGKRLVEKVCESLKKEGISKVAIVVYSDNEQGNNFWKNFDFKHLSDLNYRVRYLTNNNKLI